MTMNNDNQFQETQALDATMATTQDRLSDTKNTAMVFLSKRYERNNEKEVD